MNKAEKLLTIAIPVCNEEENLPELWKRVRAVSRDLLNRAKPVHCEFLFVDNGSSDSSGAICKSFVNEDQRARYIRFSRNFGIEASFSAGAKNASGDALVYLFSDLQDPVELIPQMVDVWQKGNDVVYGVLKKREDGNFLKSFGAYFAYRIIYLLSDIKIPLNATDFRLIGRNVIDILNSCPERNRYMRGLTHWIGFKQEGIEFERQPRLRGKSKAGFIFCLGYAMNAVFAFSEKPLKIASYAGMLATILSILGAVLYVVHALLTRAGMINITPPPVGWVTTTLLIFFFGGIQCLFLGIIGEYVARIHSETKRRPIWVVDELEGFEKVN